MVGSKGGPCRCSTYSRLALWTVATPDAFREHRHRLTRTRKAALQSSGHQKGLLKAKSAKHMENTFLKQVLLINASSDFSLTSAEV